MVNTPISTIYIKALFTDTSKEIKADKRKNLASFCLLQKRGYLCSPNQYATNNNKIIIVK